MIAHITLLALISGLAAPQLVPASVSVSAAGKSPAALHAELRSASEAVCRAAFPGPLDAVDAEQCVSSTYDRAVWQANRMNRRDPAPIRNALLVR